MEHESSKKSNFYILSGKNAFPSGNVYISIKEQKSKLLHRIELFSLFNDGSVEEICNKNLNKIELEEFNKIVLRECVFLSEDEYLKAKAEYQRRDSELVTLVRKSDLQKKFL